MRKNNNNFSQSSNIKQHCQQRGDNNFKQLWQKVKQLSEVQDESRNQQVPNFMDDNSVMSKHQQQQMHQSFVLTHIIGQNVLLDQKDNQCDGNMFIKNKVQKKVVSDNNKGMFNQQINSYKHQQQIRYDNILTQLDRQSIEEKPIINTSNSKYVDIKTSHNKESNNKQVRGSFMGFTFNPVSNKFPNLNLNVNVNKNQKRQSIKQCIKMNNIEQKVGVNPYLQRETLKIQVIKQVQQMRELNNKLMTDNRKLFEQCIKLRMKVIRLQNDNRISNQQKYKLLEQKQIQIRRQIQYSVKQSIRRQLIIDIEETIRRQLQSQYNEKILQLQEIIVRLKQQQTHYMYQKHQQQQQFNRVNIQKQQYNQQNTLLLRQIDHLNLQINEFQNRLQLKQKQLLIKQHSISQYQLKLKVLSYHNNVKYSISTQTIMTELQQTIQTHHNKLPQLHHINSVSQKSSRTNSTKSTTLTTSNNNNNNNNNLSNSHDNNNLSISHNNNNNNNNNNLPHLLQSRLKDKERQMTNIKIVHQAQLKQYKQTIKSLQTQLQNNNNK